MKSSTEKSATTTSTTAMQTPQEPFFGKKGGDVFFKSAPQGNAPFIQAKLTVNQPGDEYEQEADRVADQVVQRLAMPSPEQATPLLSTAGRSPAPIQTKCADCEQKEQVQRKEEEGPEESETIMRKVEFASAGQPPADIQTKCADCEQDEQVQRKEESVEEPEEIMRLAESAAPGSEAGSDFSSRLQSSKGGGSPLPDNTRADMESALGTDLSGVRIHTGSEAAGMSKAINAQAFTHGSDVYFNDGKFDAGSMDGKRLLAHELVHVGQQGGGGIPDVQMTSLSDKPQSEKTENSSSEKFPFNILFGDDFFNNYKDKTSTEIDLWILMHIFIVEKPEIISRVNLPIEWTSGYSNVFLFKPNKNEKVRNIRFWIPRSWMIRFADVSEVARKRLSFQSEDNLDIKGFLDNYDKAYPPHVKAFLDQYKQSGWLEKYSYEFYILAEVLKNMDESQFQEYLKRNPQGEFLNPIESQIKENIIDFAASLDMARLQYEKRQKGLRDYIEENKNHIGPGKFLDKRGFEVSEQIYSLIKNFNNSDYAELTYLERVKSIEAIVYDYYVTPDEQDVIILLIKSMPKSEYAMFLSDLQANKFQLSNELFESIEGEKKADLNQLIRHRVISSKDAKTYGQEVTKITEAYNKRKSGTITYGQSTMLLPFSSQGLFSQFIKEETDFYVEVNSDSKISAGSRINPIWEKWVGLASQSASLSFLMNIVNKGYLIENLDYNQLVGIHLLYSKENIGFKDELLILPAMNLKYLEQIKNEGDIEKLIDMGIIIASIAGIVFAPAGLLTGAAVIESALTIVDVGVKNFKEDIRALEGGDEFLNVWNTVQIGIAVFGVVELAASAPNLIKSAKNAWKKVIKKENKFENIDNAFNDLDKVLGEKTKQIDGLSASSKKNVATNYDESRKVTTETNSTGREIEPPIESSNKNESIFDGNQKTSVKESMALPNPVKPPPLKKFTPEELIENASGKNKRALPQYVQDNLADLNTLENKKIIWSDDIGSTTRGNLSEELEWQMPGGYKSKGYSNANELKENFHGIDFFDATDVVSYKTYRQYDGKTDLTNLENRVNHWAKKLSQKDIKDFPMPDGTTIPLSSKSKRLDFVVDEGVWDLNELKKIETKMKNKHNIQIVIRPRW